MHSCGTPIEGRKPWVAESDARAADGTPRVSGSSPDSGSNTPVRHPVSFGVLCVSFLALGAFPLRRALRAAPRPSLTTGVA